MACEAILCLISRPRDACAAHLVSHSALVTSLRDRRSPTKGEFFVQDTLNGKSLLNRYVWSQIASSSPHFEESWSSDGGRTWESVRIVDLARVSDNTSNAHPTGK